MPAASPGKLGAEMFAPLERAQKEFSPKAITLPKIFRCLMRLHQTAFCYCVNDDPYLRFVDDLHARACPGQSQNRRQMWWGERCGSFALPSFYPACRLTRRLTG